MIRIPSAVRFAAALAVALGASATLARAAEPQAFYETYDDGACVASRGVVLDTPSAAEQDPSPQPAPAAAERAEPAPRQPATRFLSDTTQLGADIEH